MAGLQRTRGRTDVSFHVHPPDQRPKGAHGEGFAAFWAASPHRRQGKVGAERRSAERTWVGRPKRPTQALRGSRGAPPGERVTFL